MAGQAPEREFTPTELGNGVWDESATPTKLGGKGLTACNNLTYRRYGAWGKRAGSGRAYAASTVGPTADPYASGIRWYRAAPTPLTKLVLAAQGALWTGGDPNLVAPFAPLTDIATAQNNSGTQATFAPAKDPSAYGGSGGDVLIIDGLTGPYGFATGAYELGGAVTAGEFIQLSIFDGNVGGTAAVLVEYETLPSDNVFSVAQALVQLLNTTGFLQAPNFLGFASATQTGAATATISIGAIASGPYGNGYEYKATIVSGSGVTITPAAYTNMAGGGSTVSAPLRYDGTTVSGLSYQIQQPFTGCVTWHDHVWHWGDENNPDTLYASDINQPIGFTFMNQYGGYQIGAGDGDPAIQTCIPIGNILYVFKRSSIYAITGYDFQTGEYQFNVQLAINGTGIPAPGCATLTHNNTIIYWDGGKFYRLSVGAFAPEFIGRTIPLTSGKVSKGNAALMRVVSGDFPVKAFLNNNYSAPGAATDTEILTNVVLFAYDSGSGVADTVLVYDDDASNFIGNYAWSTWSGFTVQAFIPFGSGEDAAQTAADGSALFWIPNTPAGNPLTLNEYGVDPALDAFNVAPAGIPWLAQTGWDALGTPALTKDLHRLLLDAEANPGANFACKITASGPVNGTAQTVYPSVNIEFPPTVGTAGSEANQTLIGKINPALRGYKYLFAFSEPGGNCSFEIAGVLADAITNPLTP
jgi:hypothetical protein